MCSQSVTNITFLLFISVIITMCSDVIFNALWHAIYILVIIFLYNVNTTFVTVLMPRGRTPICKLTGYASVKNVVIIIDSVVCWLNKTICLVLVGFAEFVFEF